MDVKRFQALKTVTARFCQNVHRSTAIYSRGIFEARISPKLGMTTIWSPI